MTHEIEVDMALTALLDTAKTFAPGLHEDLVRKAFAIQKRHQFDRDTHRSDSVPEMRTLINDFLDQAGSAP